MPRLSLGLGVQNIRKVGGRTIFRILISGAGTESSNGEFVKDGVINGEPFYSLGINVIYWDGSEWIIEDNIFEDNTYKSADLITWEQVNGNLPVPSATLYYTP
jgi:hypothetical protein